MITFQIEDMKFEISPNENAYYVDDQKVSRDVYLAAVETAKLGVLLGISTELEEVKQGFIDRSQGA